MGDKWKFETHPINGIWYPSRDHRDGHCDVDKAWFPPDHLESLVEQFPQSDDSLKTIRIPEEVRIETETAYHHYHFQGGIPFHGMISKKFLTEHGPKWILHRRETNG